MRLTIIVTTLLEQLARFAWLRVRLHRPLVLAERAAWLRHGSVTLLRRLDFKLIQQGASPLNALIVSNHLSHFDILAYSAASGCIFLAKSEVSRWPLFGALARCGGTIFLDRDRSHSATHAARGIRHALEAGVPVLIFPEGTTTGGDCVLPFRSMLFQPAVATATPIAAAALHYSSTTAPEHALCYYGDHTLLPHLYRCMHYAELQARIRWIGPAATYTCRKRAALATHSAIASARTQGVHAAC